MTKCCSGNDSANISSLIQLHPHHQSIDPLLVSISVLLQAHNGQMILERAPSSPQLLDSEIARSQARTSTHKEWASEKLKDLDREYPATLQRFSTPLEMGMPADTSTTQGRKNVKTTEVQPTQLHSPSISTADSLPSNTPIVPTPLSTFPTIDPTSLDISRHPTDYAAVPTSTERQYNHNDDVGLGFQRKFHLQAWASSAETKILGTAHHTQRDDTTTNLESVQRHALVCDANPSPQPPANCYITPRHPQINSYHNGKYNQNNPRRLSSNAYHDHLSSPNPDQPTQISKKYLFCDTPTKATITQNTYSLPRITKPVQYANPIQEQSHHDNPPSAPDVQFILPTAEDPPTRTDFRSYIGKTHTNTHQNDSPGPTLQSTGDRGMDLEQSTSDGGIDLGQPTCNRGMDLDERSTDDPESLFLRGI